MASAGDRRANPPDVHLLVIFRHSTDYTDYTDNLAPENPRGITRRPELRA